MTTSLANALITAGMTPVEAARKSTLFDRCEASLDKTAAAPASQSIRHYVPGRVEFLGKHTDYAGGRSLLCTVERGICLVARPRTDAQINIAALDLDATASFTLSPELEATRGDWSNYPMTVARRLARNFPPTQKIENQKSKIKNSTLLGADIALASDLPPAAGLSSSSAFIIAVFLALRDVNNLTEHPAYQQNIRSIEDLSGYLGCNENGQTFGSLPGDKGVGTFGGSQDHTAILCCKPNHLSQYAFCPVRYEATVPWPKNTVLAIGVSGIIAEKTGAAMELYNSASKRTRAIVDTWNNSTGRSDPTVAAALASSQNVPHDLRRILANHPLRLTDRLDQFQTESETIIPGSVQAIREGGGKNLTKLGELIDLSQKNAEKLLLNQVPETIALCRIAREEGAHAASAFGAGFGGAVWALIDESKSEPFLVTWANRYHQQFPSHSHHSNFLLTRPGPAAQKL
ncbi:MAG: hypothetical protein FWD61_12970 [Phycisphaerales bacterium]|nr:hypothetical protein [Phycisphaerales bacterium]